jgi:hypothetical protein
MESTRKAGTFQGISTYIIMKIRQACGDCQCIWIGIQQRAVIACGGWNALFYFVMNVAMNFVGRTFEAIWFHLHSQGNASFASVNADALLSRKGKFHLLAASILVLAFHLNSERSTITNPWGARVTSLLKAHKFGLRCFCIIGFLLCWKWNLGLPTYAMKVPYHWATPPALDHSFWRGGKVEV